MVVISKSKPKINILNDPLKKIFQLLKKQKTSVILQIKKEKQNTLKKLLNEAICPNQSTDFVTKERYGKLISSEQTLVELLNDNYINS